MLFIPSENKWIVDNLGLKTPILEIKGMIRFTNNFPFQIATYIKRQDKFIPFLMLDKNTTYYYRPDRTFITENNIKILVDDEIYSKIPIASEWLTTPKSISPIDTEIVFGYIQSLTKESKVVYNLAGEITSLVFENYCNLEMQVFYGNNLLGILPKGPCNINYLKSSNGQAGFRINTNVTFIPYYIQEGMIVKLPFFNISLKNLKMDTIELGLVYVY